MSTDSSRLAGGLPEDAAERFTLDAGKRMSLRNRLLWLEEIHELVLRWSRKRPMMYPDGTTIGPEPLDTKDAR